MVLWLIGLSASGKTTIGNRLKELLDAPSRRWVIIDGDAFREAMGGETGHDLEERRKNAYRISRFCRLLELQELNVIACVLSLFPDNREFNRSLFADYREVYIRTSLAKLEARDNKRIYAEARAGRLKDVAGVDIPFPEPANPDYILDNDADTADFGALARRIAGALGLEAVREYAYPRPGHAPEKYQYAPYEGPGFLSAYRASRAKALSLLDARSVRLRRVFARLPDAPHFLADKYALPGPAGHFLAAELRDEGAGARPGRLGTRAFLLEALREGPMDRKEGLLRLLGRFEATKKLHSEYRVPEWRKSPEAGEDALDRILLSLALLDWMAVESDRAAALIAFNAALKLNDLLAASLPALATPAEACLGAAALRAELAAFDTLAERGGA